MYLCTEVALCGIAHGIGRPTGPGGGAHQKVGPKFNPVGTIGPTSCTLAHTYTLGVLSVTNFTLGS